MDSMVIAYCSGKQSDSEPRRFLQDSDSLGKRGKKLNHEPE